MHGKGLDSIYLLNKVDPVRQSLDVGSIVTLKSELYVRRWNVVLYKVNLVSMLVAETFTIFDKCISKRGT